MTVAQRYVILFTVKVIANGRITVNPIHSDAAFLFPIRILKGVFDMIHSIRKHTANDRAEANYISTVVYILVVVITLAVIMDVLAVIMTKQKLDAAADQVTRQIQLSGKVDEDTSSLVEFLSSDLGKADNLIYSVDTSYITKEGCSTAIQLGTPFYLTITADLQLGGFWQITGLPMTLKSTAAGVSERYWK